VAQDMVKVDQPIKSHNAFFKIVFPLKLIC
jgi:hypothetical protein